jgi:hypothetical protein
MRSSAGARSTAAVIAANSAFTPANGRIEAACSAIHGEYSKIFASAATNSSLLAVFSSVRLFDMAYPMLAASAARCARLA